MSFLKLLLSFAPWVAFLIIARGSLARVEFALVIAFALSAATAALKLQRGVIMWVSLTFFAAATIAVVGFRNMWTVGHLGVLANGALALGAWGTLLIGRPFTLEYAREHTEPAKWNDPLFIRVNVLLTALWATTFTINTALAWAPIKDLWPEWVGRTASYVALIAAAAFTSWYPAHLRRGRRQQSGGVSQPT